MSEQQVQESTAEPIVSPFSSQVWTETPPDAPEVKETPPATPPATPEAKQEPPVTPPVTNEEALDVKEWVKREFGWDDPEIGKKELEELRAKAKTPAEIKYANEQSRLLHEALEAGKEEEVYKILHNKRELERITGADVTKMSAEEIVKYDIKKKNDGLSKEDVDFIYNKRFAIPREPVQGAAESDEEFETRVNEWKNTVQEKERELIIEAKMALPELNKLKTEIKLPEIQKSVDPKEAEAQQKELERIDGLRKQYLQHLESDYRKFNGYEIKYKDEDVEIPVSFGITPEEQDALKTELATFNIDGFISERWFNKDGTPNITQLMSDVTLLRKGENVFQKIANEVGTKMKDHYIKLKSNINLNGSGQNGAFQPKANGQSVDPFKVDSWAETPA